MMRENKSYGKQKVWMTYMINGLRKPSSLMTFPLVTENKIHLMIAIKTADTTKKLVIESISLFVGRTYPLKTTLVVQILKTI